MDILRDLLILDCGILIGFGLTCFVILRGGCYSGCLLRKTKE